MTKALALMSGGLDSVLAAKHISNLGIEVLAICFKSAFFGSDNAEKMAAQVGLELKVVDFTEVHLEMVKKPKHGYGKNMNPCIDCHAMMLNYAGKMLETEGADFIITGEVLDQRPMSQNKKSLETVKRESGYESKILRPLSALNLPPTQMEADGLVDREKLLKLSGKTRKPQMEMAKQMGIVDYPTPAGGCLLTESQFSNKLRDLLEKDSIATAHDVELLKTGRHFRLNDHLKLVSTRDKEEYEKLMAAVKDHYYVLNTTDFAGSSVVLIPTETYTITEEDLQLAGGITGRYCKGKEEPIVKIKYKKGLNGEYQLFEATPMKDEEIKTYLIC